MYFEETMIDGVMHWRGTPTDDFRPYTLMALSARYTELKETLQQARAALR